MIEPVFARTRHVYDSYTDFWRLVALSGFETVYLDEIEWTNDNRTYIFTPLNGEIAPMLDIDMKAARRCKLIWWNLEPTDGVPHVERMQHPAISIIDDIWVSDRWVAGQHQKYRHAVLGGHPLLAGALDHALDKKVYNFAHLCAAWGRREGMIRQLQARGLSVAPTHGLFATDASPLLYQSRAMLALHQHLHTPIIAPLRFAMAAAHGLPLITEDCNDLFPHRHGHDLLSVRFHADDIAKALQGRSVGAPLKYEMSGLAGGLQHTLHKVWNFRAGVEDALYRWFFNKERFATNGPNAMPRFT